MAPLDESTSEFGSTAEAGRSSESLSRPAAAGRVVRNDRMRAFLGSAVVRRKIVKRVRAHLNSGDVDPTLSLAWNTSRQKGSLIGAMVHSTDLAHFELETGLPAPLAMLHETLHGAMHEWTKVDGRRIARVVNHAALYPIQWLEAIPLGANLQGVTSSFLASMLTGLANSELSESTARSASLLVAKVASDSTHVPEGSPAGARRAVLTLIRGLENLTWRAEFTEDQLRFLDEKATASPAPRRLSLTDPTAAARFKVAQSSTSKVLAGELRRRMKIADEAASEARLDLAEHLYQILVRCLPHT